MMRWPSIQKDKASIKHMAAESRGLSVAWRSPGPCDAASHNECGLSPASHVMNKRWSLPRVLCNSSKVSNRNRGGVECRHAAGNAREPGGSFEWGAPKAEIRNAAATTSRCVGSDKVARRSCDRPAIISYAALITLAAWVVTSVENPCVAVGASPQRIDARSKTTGQPSHELSTDRPL